MTRLNGLTYSIKASGDGYEVLDANGEVIAWVLDRIWALRILLGLELLDDSLSNNFHRHDDK